MHCTPSPLTTHPPPSACWPAAWQHPDDRAADAAADAADGSMPCGPRWDMGGGRGGGHASKALLSLSGQELERGKYGGGPVVVVLARIGVAVPEPCRCCPPSSLRSLHLRCISCHAGDVGVALAHASRVGGPGQNGSRLGPSSTETLLQFPQNPPAKRAGAIHDAVANSEEHGSMESWEASHGCRRGWHSGRLETRQSHGFKISRLNLAGPCRRLGGLGCCPALRLLGAPFPDASSTTTHTTHAHGTRRPSILHQQATLARAWDDPVGASLLAFLSSMGTVVFGLGGATLLLFAHGDDGCVSKGAAPFCVLPMGACRGRVTGHLASTGQQLQPSSLLCADR